MSRKHTILIAPYAFKGTLSATEVSDAIGSAMSREFPASPTIHLPLGDGGGGTLDAFLAGAGGSMMRSRCTQATGVMQERRWGILDDGAGVIEAAECIALADVPIAERFPERLTTMGVGEQIGAAIEHGVTTMYVGLGDTATHDCGLGMAYALGFRFYDAGGRELMPVGAMLSRLATVDAAFVPSTIRNLNCTALCDVMNPLLGSDGAALRFASQKGADSTTVMRLEDGGVRFAKIVSRDLGVEVATLAGAGAAGGLGAGLAAFLGARLVSGAETLLDVVGFDSMLQGCHAVITGEGRVDEKTLLGKGVAQVARRAAAHGVHCVIVAGSIEGEKEMLEEKLKATIILLHESRADAESTRLGIARASGVVRDALMNA